MRGSGFSVARVARGVFQLTDVLGCRCYLVCGDSSCLLVDTASGLGDLRSCVRELTGLPVTVACTHGHYDHVAGAWWFDEAFIGEADAGCIDVVADHARRVHAQVVEEGLVGADEAFSVRVGSRPHLVGLAGNESFCLGGRRVSVVGLAGHTQGSLGYLVEDERLLLSGDAVTPIMCLFFDDSSTVGAWASTVRAMGSMPFDRFMTGHHDHVFTKADLRSFEEAAAFAETDRGVAFQHERIEEYRGILHLCPCATSDADAPDFRAVIERWHELPPRRRGRRRRA